MWHHLEEKDQEKARQLSFRLGDPITIAIAKGYKDAAVFSRFDMENLVTHFYFSPQAAGIAKSVGAKPCPTPLPADTGNVSIGDSFAFDRLFK
ncbi:MAG TPA: hypothetical protein PKE57_02365 [Cellvibrionaceae bacterium]|nr:hypothetical protein [Cellvibrionaceae bacterium]HMW71461.1 hypothetical protein [Cellvibrionaceae bacterium]HMY40965.1 hypothetical protein [Marinagarivorans sp.]HNG59027.1 hypothetical protein [Cellvibrionaceae bacterium]